MRVRKGYDNIFFLWLVGWVQIEDTSSNNMIIVDILLGGDLNALWPAKLKTQLQIKGKRHLKIGSQTGFKSTNTYGFS